MLLITPNQFRCSNFDQINKDLLYEYSSRYPKNASINTVHKAQNKVPRICRCDTSNWSLKVYIVRYDGNGANDAMIS
jgi:hypothetical protein